MAKKKTNRSGESTAAADDQDIGKIRDIIFGTSMREYETRFAALEKRIEQQSERLKVDLERRTEKLEKLIANQVAKIDAGLTKEKEARTTSQKAAAAEVKVLNKEIEARLGELATRLADESKDLGQQWDASEASLVDQIQQLQNELKALINKEAEALDRDKVARGDLAHLLQEVADRLHGADPTS